SGLCIPTNAPTDRGKERLTEREIFLLSIFFSEIGSGADGTPQLAGGAVASIRTPCLFNLGPVPRFGVPVVCRDWVTAGWPRWGSGGRYFGTGRPNFSITALSLYCNECCDREAAMAVFR